MRMNRYCFGLLFILFSGCATCFSQQMNAADAPCKSVGVNVDITNCMFKAWKTADADLNRVYVQSRKRVEGADLQRLIAAQRLWVQFRDANCNAAYGLYGGGSAGPMVRAACLEKDTRERIEELKVMYSRP
jgi:uncharacterized protein YecT (DUF1311 family)